MPEAQMPQVRRIYVPAWLAQTGYVIPCGHETISASYAAAEARVMHQEWQTADPSSPAVFVAFMDRPNWQRLDSSPGGEA